jgi:hypothetical protein
VQDGGEWLCSLFKQPNLPVEIDGTADARHEDLPLALLSVLVETKRKAHDAREPRLPLLPHIRPAIGTIACGDNFA